MRKTNTKIETSKKNSPQKKQGPLKRKAARKPEEAEKEINNAEEEPMQPMEEEDEKEALAEKGFLAAFFFNMVFGRFKFFLSFFLGFCFHFLLNKEFEWV